MTRLAPLAPAMPVLWRSSLRMCVKPWQFGQWSRNYSPLRASCVLLSANCFMGWRPIGIKSLPHSSGPAGFWDISVDHRPRRFSACWSPVAPVVCRNKRTSRRYSGRYGSLLKYYDRASIRRRTGLDRMTYRAHRSWPLQIGRGVGTQTSGVSRNGSTMPGHWRKYDLQGLGRSLRNWPGCARRVNFGKVYCCARSTPPGSPGDTRLNLRSPSSAARCMRR